MIIVTQVPLTFAQIRTAFSVPVLILAAPPSGYVRNIFGITEYMDNVGVNYVNPTTELYVQIEIATKILFQCAQLVTQGATQEEPVQKVSPAHPIYSQTLPLYFQTDADDAVGQHGMIITIVSELKQITT